MLTCLRSEKLFIRLFSDEATAGRSGQMPYLDQKFQPISGLNICK